MNTLTPTVTANAARQPATTRKVNRATEGCAAGDDATLGCHSTASPWRANASTGNSGTSSPATAGGGSGASTGSSGVAGASSSTTLAFVSLFPAGLGPGLQAV